MLRLRQFLIILTCSIVLPVTTFAGETLVFLRHGEKPAAGKGQINCQGLNRSLALPAVLTTKFGKPTALFAPNPAKQKHDIGIPYDYIRPLATIEPTAVLNDLPVNLQYGFSDTDKLVTDLLTPRYKDATIFIAWEHKLIDVAVRDLIKRAHGDTTLVPDWDTHDFDSLYVLKLTTDGAGHKTVTFAVDKQGLTTLATTCPGT